MPRIAKSASGPNPFRSASDGVPATLAAIDYLGADTIVTAELGGCEVAVRVPGRVQAAPGERLGLSWDERDVHVFDQDGRRADLASAAAPDSAARGAVAEAVSGTLEGENSDATTEAFITAAASAAATIFALSARRRARSTSPCITRSRSAARSPRSSTAWWPTSRRSHPDIKVHAIYAGNYNDARVKALAALKSGQPAELSVMFSIDLYELVEQGAIEPFDDLVKTEADKAWLKSFYPALMANGELDGKTWSIPFQRSTIVMYYNKDAFKEAGLDPQPAAGDLGGNARHGQEAGEEERQRRRRALGRGDPLHRLSLLDVPGAGDRERPGADEPDGKKVYFDSPASVQALRYWHDLSAKDGVMPKGTVEWGTLRQAFLDGKTAIMWHSTGNLTAVKKAAKFDFGVAMLPAEKRRGSPTGGGNFYIFKAAKPAAKSRRAHLHQVDDGA